MTTDGLLHVLLGAAVMALAWLYLPLAAASALYLREVVQADSWVLSWRFHKFSEVLYPSLALVALWELWLFLG